MEFKRLSYQNKNSKFLYYFKNYLRQLVPSLLFQKKLHLQLNDFEKLNSKEKEELLLRLNYYNQLEEIFILSKNAQKLSEIKLQKNYKTYYFDLHEYSRYFSQHLKGHFLFGDITKTPKEPGLVKSRPINKNTNSIILKWNKIRHFTFIKKDTLSYSKKKEQLVFRAKVHSSQPQRIKFLEKYYGHPMCNIGKVNNNNLKKLWMVERMTYIQQLQYKFILCLEGNDVASNLKWVMSSNSIAVMPKPKYETWFMEGLLIPDQHYILIKDDYSDLENRLKFFLDHPEKAKLIVENANKHVNQFKDQKKEDLLSFMVLNKYFTKTN
mgnify:FL=1